MSIRSGSYLITGFILFGFFALFPDRDPRRLPYGAPSPRLKRGSSTT